MSAAATPPAKVRIPAGGSFQSRKPEAKARYATTGGVRGQVIQAVREARKQMSAADIAKSLKMEVGSVTLHLNRAAVDGLVTRTTSETADGKRVNLYTTRGATTAKPAARARKARKAVAKR